MNDHEIKELIRKYLDGTASAEETGMLESWYAHQAANAPDGIENTEVKESLQRIAEGLPLQRTVYRKISWPRVAAAIVLLLLVGAGGYFWMNSSNKPGQTETQRLADIAPGGNRATLTLAGGKTIALSEAQSGIIVDEEITYADGTAVLTDSLQPDEGLKSHLPAGKAGISNLLSISTPRGGQYQIQLPDGTKVWLNAASSLSYPASFAGLGDRRVELTGEAYFEVAKDADHPFIVQTDKQSVEVLGTHFNIKAYANEPTIQTTLLEGSVKVSPALPAGRHLNTHLPAGKAGISHLLTPGQQAILSDNGFKVMEVDPASAIAWKNGRFVFDGESLEGILRKISRWYNVDIEFQDEAAKEILFGGSMSRFDNISKVLHKLEITGNVRLELVKSANGSSPTVKVNLKPNN